MQKWVSPLDERLSLSLTDLCRGLMEQDEWKNLGMANVGESTESAPKMNADASNTEPRRTV